MGGKDDGSYDSLTNCDESPDFKENKTGQRSPKKEAKETQTKKRKKEKKKTKKEKKREGAMLLSFCHTCASE